VEVNETVEVNTSLVTSILTCWQHIHPDEYSIFDFTRWTFKHSGNSAAFEAGRPNPIKQFAELASASIVFPSHHTMVRWKSQWEAKAFPYVGRYGDEVIFSTLPTEVQTAEMAERFGALVARSSTGGGFEACGSRAEVANSNLFGNQYYFHTEGGRKGAQDKYLEGELDHPYPQIDTKGAVWTNVVLKADDQLRQRVAWALSQVLVLGEMKVHGDEGDPWYIAYDIFVRHAFGNYRDVLREVTYNPFMGEYLTYFQNKALAVGTYPDENYAREVMQLFSIGLWKTHADGTPIRDENGEPLPTYDNDDVATFARVWTGFDKQPARSNVATQNGRDSGNGIDPMTIRPSWRDRLPKTKLDAGYLGDGVPLCSELQPRYFLSKGAQYRYIGTSSAEGGGFDDNAISTGVDRFEPSPVTSALYQSLCQAGADGNCTFPLDVTLDQTLTCDGHECTADRLRSVKVVDASSGKIAWYLALRPRCVRLTFAANTVYTKVSSAKSYHQCSDPKAAIATVACCEEDYGKWGGQRTMNSAGNFAAEFVTYSTAEARCAAKGGVICNTHSIGQFTARFTKGGGDGYYSWIKKPCTVQVQVHANGWVNVVEPLPAGTTQSVPELKLNNPNAFRVRWHNSSFPTYASGCQGVGGAASNCTMANDNTCLCDISVKDAAVFTDTSKVPSKEELHAALFVGSVAPGDFGDGSYIKCTNEACSEAESDDVRIYNKAGNTGITGSTSINADGEASALGMDTIFEIPGRLAGSSYRYLRNRASTVHVDGGFSFRNPPNFMPLMGEVFSQKPSWGEDTAVRDAEWEVEALLDHLFEHDSTAPFVAHKLLQRLVTSNPSPRYVKEVATAFRTGVYKPAGRAFSGRYGDLGAAVAAVLLDREARSASLDADPTHGKLLEPLLKVLHVMRAMEYTPNDGREVVLSSMEGKVGMAPFMSPSVFNYYVSDFQSAGPVEDAALVSPEAQLSTTPLMVGYLNGISSLIDHGLTSCYSGFGVSAQKPARKCSGMQVRSGETQRNADGVLAFAPTSTTAHAVVNELDLLLTAGRLTENTKRVIASAYTATLESGGSQSAALKKAQKLAVITPEFHATNRNVKTHPRRKPEAEQVSHNRPFKAIVVITLNGGCDSFNLLVPHSGCTSTGGGAAHDLYAEYKTTRTNIALEKAELLQVDSPAGAASAGTTTQPCTKFGLHPSLKFLQEMYTAGKSAWVANIGALVEPTTPTQFAKKTVRLPPSLFAHNVQQRVMHNVHAQYTSAHGVLGRAITSLTSSGNEAAPYRSELFSLMGNTKLLEGAPRTPVVINDKRGIAQYKGDDQTIDELTNLTQPTMSSAFSESYAQNLGSLLSSMKGVSLGELLSTTTLDTGSEFDAQYKASSDAGVWNGGLSLQLKQVANVLKRQSELDLERAAFAVKLGGFDTHDDGEGELKILMTDVDESLKVFVKELKAQGLWENVTIVTVSDFGRTLSSNGKGSDHAWGGNHFLLGGSVNGGRIFGTFPPSLALDSELMITKRGSVLPTTSWEGMWKGLVEWLGVEDQQMATVLPNLANFPAEDVISGAQMFTSL
jgi:cullin-associated NEDD8-dissociated protein 1